MKKKVYFIPGTMCTKRLWEQSWELLDSRVFDEYDFIHLSIPTQGSLAEIVDELGTQLRQAPGYVLGFSLGGYIAGKLVIKFGDAITKLMIVSNSLKALPQKEVKLRRNILEWMENNAYQGVTTKRIMELLYSNCANKQAIVDCMKTMDKELGEKIFKHQLSVSTARSNILEQVCQNAIDLTFLIGKDDPLVHCGELIKAVKHFPQHKVHSVAQCGHMLPLEHPSIFAKVLSTWL